MLLFNYDTDANCGDDEDDDDADEDDDDDDEEDDDGDDNKNANCEEEEALATLILKLPQVFLKLPSVEYTSSPSFISQVLNLLFLCFFPKC